MTVLLLSIMNSLIVPLELSFEPVSFSGTGYVIFDNLVDLIFLIDMILMLFTSFVAKNGEQVFDQTKIVKKYATS